MKDGFSALLKLLINFSKALNGASGYHCIFSYH
jgi:hypothetical protein